MIPKGLLASAALSLLVLAPNISARDQTPGRDPHGPEVARIQEHLARVERELIARDVSGLTSAQQKERHTQIERLRAYRIRGQFPHNENVADRRVPYFVDRHGTLCAMAHLIALAGGEELVRHVAQARNNAKVTELAADPRFGPALSAWLARAGLTVDEAQRIQPAYTPVRILRGEDRLTTSYAVSSGSLAAVNAVAIGINGADAAGGHGPAWVGVLGVTAGTAEMVLGITNWNRPATRGLFAVANTAIGALSFVIGTAALANRSEREAVYVEAEPAGVSLKPGVWVHESLGPMVGIGAAF